ncbi:unnamed protein product [Camellia sinensis]
MIPEAGFWLFQLFSAFLVLETRATERWEECPVLAISVPIAVEDCRGRCKIFGSGPVREHCRGFRSPVGDPPLDMGMGFLGDELEG